MEEALSTALQAHAYGQARAILCDCGGVRACQVAGIDEGCGVGDVNERSTTASTAQAHHTPSTMMMLLFIGTHSVTTVGWLKTVFINTLALS